MPFNNIHLQFFIDCYANNQNPALWIGHAPRNWALGVINHHADLNNEDMDDAINILPIKALDRNALSEFILNNEDQTLACVLSILAWGGMHINNGALLLNTRNDWLPLCNAIRHGEHTREEAYRNFMQLRNAGQLRGMGPAYFTKLIYFLHPNHDGYIMDQWTASSINMLCDEAFIDLSPGYYVTDNNTPETYERYCNTIENLSDLLGICPNIVEERLFSSGRQGGNPRHYWRQYVIDNR